MARTFVVAAATLAILLVCFSIYQYSQIDPAVSRRLHETQSASADAESPRPPGTPQATDAPGVPLRGGGSIGPGKRVSMTLYGQEGRRPWGEISGKDWTPVAGSAREFILSDPEIRMRTKSGHPARVTAQRATLETTNRPGSGTETDRGKLTGNVVIEYDRLTDAERDRLREQDPDRPDPRDIVRIETDAIEFDLEYSKLIVPGPLHVSARDADLQMGDLEIRFSETEDRVEYLRVGRGGRLELRERMEGLDLPIPALGEADERKLTLTEWLRASIQARVDAQQPTTTAAESAEPVPPVTVTDEGVPVIHMDARAADVKSEPPIRYFARFEGDVDARQSVQGKIQTRLEAEALEIVRDPSDLTEPTAEAAQQVTAERGDTTTAPPEEVFVLEWSERLVVEACSPGEARCGGDQRAKIVAYGSPVRLFHPKGDAACSQLTYDPDGAEVWLDGTEPDPVVVRYVGQGTLTGTAVYSQRHDDDMYIRVTGPGTLARVPLALSGSSPPAGGAEGGRSGIAFTEEFEAEGRFVTTLSPDFADQTLVRRRQRVLDRAVFRGGVRMHQDDTGVSADALTLTFDPTRRGDKVQTVRHVLGDGHVEMEQGADRLRCSQVDMVLTTHSDGRTWPKTVTATGDVYGVQDERTIRAQDKLVIDLEPVRRSAPPFDAAKAYAAAVEAGLDVSAVDWEARRREHESRIRTEAGVRRLRAWGDVSVRDPIQPLEVDAEQLDCTVVDGRDIERAFVQGRDDRPASVRLDTFGVSGREIRLHVPDQWAEVPGAGRMTFRSYKDLDGRKVDAPIPILVTWNDWMKFHGRENRSVFAGGVHATSRTSTTFDCDRLIVEFEDVKEESIQTGAVQDWWILQEFADRLSPGRSADRPRLGGRRFSKEPTYIEASGHAVAMTSESLPDSSQLKSRARIAGPKLSVYLRPDVSRMLIEGPGNLLLEDYRPDRESGARPIGTSDGLFAIDEDTGPSNTLIEWNDLMWYDFSIDQTRFEGKVSLKYFSGAQLDLIRGRGASDRVQGSPGRSTFLQCDVLTVDFLERSSRSRRSGGSRMGGLSAEQLRQFRATGSVVLQDHAEGLWLTADDLVYEKQREILVIQGKPGRKAHIVKQSPGQLPSQMRLQRAFYNLSTGEVELSAPTFDTR